MRLAVSVLAFGHTFSYKFGKPPTQQLVITHFACFLVISSCLQIFGLEYLVFSELNPSCSPNVSEMQRDPRITVWIPKLAAV